MMVLKICEVCHEEREDVFYNYGTGETLCCDCNQFLVDSIDVVMLGI